MFAKSWSGMLSLEAVQGELGVLPMLFRRAVVNVPTYMIGRATVRR